VIRIADTEFDAKVPSWRFPAQGEHFFEPNGVLRQALEEEGVPYEHRPPQIRMARAVAEVLATHEHLLVEAGTGVGKSFAYLVPLILATVERRQRAVVSTWTISLQEQLLHRDIPFLRRHLGVRFHAAWMIGRSNYVCRRRLHYLSQHPELQPNERFRIWLPRLLRWAETATEGTLQEFGEGVPPDVWDAVCSEDGTCSARKCTEAAGCFYRRARERAAKADLLVVNHHLLLSDLAMMAAEGRAFLPRYDSVVVDEAHQLEDVASDHFGLRLSRTMFTHALGRLYSDDGRHGLLLPLREGELCTRVARAREEADRFFQEVSRVYRHTTPADLPGATRRLRGPLNVTTSLPADLLELAKDVRKLSKRMDDDQLRVELQQLARRLQGLAEGVQTLFSDPGDERVHWIEWTGHGRRVSLHAAPVEVGPILRAVLFERVNTVVLTSGTLAVQGSFEYVRRRFGVPECPELQLGSPFDLARQMCFRVPHAMPDPDSPEFPRAVARAIVRLATENHGGTLVLFTNARMMNDVAELVRCDLERAGLELLVQGEGTSRHRLVELFREGGGRVLFGLDSFWIGVDIPGEALTQVVIVRLPFAVPDDPMTEARMERIRERGGDPFMEFSLPAAVIKFRQGVGRLIRRATDRGVVVVLDHRLVTRWYGRWFLQSFAQCPVEWLDEPDLS